MNPNEFITLAVQLSNNAAEASQRSALSRGYYGAFHEAKELIESCGFKLPNAAEAHTKLRFCMDASEDTDIQDAARKLKSLRDNRNIADYDLTDGRFRTKKFTSIQLGEVRSVLDCLARARLRLPVFRQKVRDYAENTLRMTLR